MSMFSKRYLLLVVFILLPAMMWASGSLPVISSVSPNNVPAGQVISVAGSNFGSSPGQLTLGGAVVTTTSWSSNSINFAVPWTAKTGANAVVVKTSAGSSSPATLNVQFVPVITSISPTIGLPSSQVTVTGTGFGANTAGTVSFNGVAGQIVSWSDTQIVVTAPNGSAGRGPVVVSWQGVNSNGITFSYIPTLSYLSPSTVALTYGSFAIVGENFLTSAGTVTLNGVALPIYSWSNNSISLPVPQNNCTGPIVVTTIYGASNASTLTITGTTPGCIGGSPLTITANASPAANSAGWNDSNVTVSYACAGGTAPVQCPASQVVSTEGAGQVVSATATDAAGKTATAKVTLNIDKTAPTITASATSGGNKYASGSWTDQPVIVTFACTDSLSGVNTVTSPVTVGTNGANQSATGTCTDKAGNTSSITFSGIDIDTGKPSLSATATTADGKAYSAGQWTNQSVTVSFTCTDTSSGVATLTPSSPVTLTGQGANQSVTGTCTDKAGATTTVTFGPVDIDNTAPQLMAAATTSNGQAYTAGEWTSLPVTVTFTCTDSLSGVSSVTAPVTLSSGSGQTVTGTCTDNAGNSVNPPVTFGPINIDTTPPILTATATTGGSPYTPGQWTNQSVVVSFTCVDSQSGVVTSPPSVTVSTPGANQSVNGSCTDGAGITSAITFGPINIDTTPPVITATAATADGKAYTAGQWTAQAVTVTFNCTDSGSGVSAYTPATTVSSNGGGQSVIGTCTDNAGNTATTTFTPINIDTTVPVLAATATAGGQAYTAGQWTNQAVTVNFACVDNTSGVATVTPPVTVSGEGANQSVNGTCTNNAGISASISFAPINIDKTAPVITASATSGGVAYVSGQWTAQPVIVTFNCTDSLSGVSTFTPPATLSGNGAGQSVNGTCTDNAGNAATTTFSGINIDTGKPVITATAATADGKAYAAGQWTNQSVTVTFVCTDTGSGVASVNPASPVTISGEGQNQSVSGTCTDNAGVPASVSFSSINIDKTAPVITATAATADGKPYTSGQWTAQAVTVTFNCTDSLSGVSTFTPPATLSGNGAGQSVNGTCTDNAGNPATTTFSGINIDTGKPVFTATAVTADGKPYTAGQWTNQSVTVTFACTDSGSGVASVNPASPVTISGEGQNQSVSGTCTDNAGVPASVSFSSINIDKTAPVITGTAATADGKPYTSGQWTAQSVTVTFNCTDSLSGVNSFTPATTLSGNGAGQSVNGTCTDNAGNPATTTFSGINIDTGQPSITATAITANGQTYTAGQWTNQAVTVSFACTDTGSGVATLTPAGPVTLSGEGANQSVNGTCTDKAGTAASLSFGPIDIDLTPPTIVATATPPPNAAGWNDSAVTVSFVCADNLSGVVSCPSPSTVSGAGANQAVSGTVSDQAGNSASASVNLNIDLTPPTILQLTAPGTITLLNPGQASVTAQDNLAITQVVFTLNGTTLATLTTPPYQVNLAVPAGAQPGNTLTLTVQVTDLAGNTASASQGVMVSTDGVIVGQVLSDATGLPIQGATAVIEGGSGAPATTDEHGQYSVPATGSHLFMSFATDPTQFTTVEREVYVQEGVGTVPVDARLTPLATATPVGSAGGSVSAGNLAINVPAGAVADGSSLQLTALSGQGLPGLLPLGWTALAAFDLRGSAASSLPVTVSALTDGAAHLVTYNTGVHAWTMVTPNLSISGGSVTLTVAGAGAFALVQPDQVTPPLAIADPGQPLAGLSVASLPLSATSTGSLNPAIMAPTGGTSTASLQVQPPGAVPSGTVIQAEVSENYTLTSGEKVSEEGRFEDVILYNAPNAANGPAMAAQFPVTPSHQFTLSDLVSGDVHLDILAGREGVRGQAGGSNAVVVTNGNATLSLAGGSLPQNTAVNVEPTSFDPFLPQSSAMTAVEEVAVDFSGQVLNSPAQIAIPAAGLNPTDTFAVAFVDRVNGVVNLRMVALAQVNGTQLVSVPPSGAPSLPGITQEGEYVFYDLAAPLAFISGSTTSTAGPVSAVVATDSLPFVDISTAGGQFLVPALAGNANLTATVLNSSLSGSAAAQAVAGQTVTANITLNGAVTTATVTPANGALAVSQSAQITVKASTALNPQSVSSASITLTEATPQGNRNVAVRTVLSADATTLAIIPAANLDPASTFTIQVGGLTDIYNQAVAVPVSSFTTISLVAQSYNPNLIVFSFPDQNGMVTISAPAGTLQPGTTVMIVDLGNGVTLSLTTGNDGSLNGQFPGTINDQLQITVTDPKGGISSFTRSQFVAPDGSTAVGAGGGTVTDPASGMQMILPAGAVAQGTVFKLQALDATAFPQLPNWQGVNFGSGMQITAPSMPTFSKEVKLAFPVPANAPPGAFYYVYRQLTDQNNNVYFETIDHAFVQGQGAQAQVVTASPPFCGYMNSDGSFQNLATAFFSPFGTAVVKTFMMWDYDPNQPGVASAGLIVGKILQTVQPAAGQTTYAPFTGSATIQLTNSPNNVAIWNPTCGTFTLFDPQWGGGPRSVTAYANGQTLQATANEVNGIQLDDADYDITAGLELLYRNIGRINFTLAPVTPPPPPPQVNIGIYTADGNPAPGIVQTGTSLAITFTSSLSVTGATINGAQYSVTTDSLPTSTAPGAYHLNTNPYVPGSPGDYTITATALPALGGSPVTTSRSFLVVQEGGSNAEVTPQVAPTFSSVPVNGATGVDTSTVPQITFSEPVTNVAGNVTLVDGENNSVPFLMIGIRRPSDPAGPVANPVAASDVITSLTLQPLTGLKFGEAYTLSVGSNIVDLNTPPLRLATQGNANMATVQFTTFGPQALGSTAPFSSTRPVVIGQRAYVGEYVNASLSGLDIINITNPALPNEEGVQAGFVGRAVDASGQASSPVNNGNPLVAIAAGIGQIPLPSNIWLYDVSTPDVPIRVAGVSATTSASQDGALLRIFMKDQYIYTSTYPKGLQVIDLQQAISEYNQVYASSPTEFGEAISTDGDGFALDAVVNTIPVQLNEYQGGCVPSTQTICTPMLDSSGNVLTMPATMLDVKAAAYAPPKQNFATQTLMVATGRLPLVVADPSQPWPGAILYPQQITVGSVQDLSQAPLASPAGQCQLPQNIFGQCNLQNGIAVALGTVSAIDSQGNTTSEQVAVVVGTGTANLAGISTPGVPLLAVVNMNNPQLPVPQGFIQLGASPTDVVLNGTTALVGTGSNVLLINIADPAQPLAAGQITGGFGNLLAITPTGFLVTTSPSAANGGLQAAALQPVIVTQCPGPILAAVVSGAGTQNPVYQTVQPVPCNISVVPATTPAATANFSLTQANQVPVVPSSTVALASDAAQVQIPAGTQITGNSVNAQSAAVNSQSGAHIPSLTQTIPVGTVHIVVDSDNDTNIDPVKDPAAAQAGSKFAFWQADPNNHSINGGQDALLDYASLRVYVSEVPDPSVGKIQLLLSSNNSTASWVLTKNVAVPDGSTDAVAASNEKLYLVDTSGSSAATSQGGATAINQVAVTNSTAVVCGANSGNSFESKLCGSVAGRIELPAIQAGKMYDLLFSYLTDTCLSQASDPASCLQDTSWTLKAVLLKNDQSTVILDQIPVDIRPLQERMTVYTMRSGVLQPLYTPVLLQPWMDIPSAATKLNLLVHGYNVSQAQATQTQPGQTAFFPNYFKRLYWTGYPVMIAQGNVQTVGITWAGDISLLNWPDDEYSALISGAPLGNFFSAQAAAGRTMSVIAHSVGNMVVNSAFTRPESAGALTAHAISGYVMNEAAIPSEAFDPLSAAAPSPNLASNAISDDGYSGDQIWQSQYNDFTTAQQQAWNGILSAQTYVTLPHPYYSLRWTQQRPPNGVPDSAPADTVPQRGSWLGFFASNPSQVTITNTVNANDFVLGRIWWSAQYFEKPNISQSTTYYTVFTNLLTFGQQDDATKQFWGSLRNTDAGQEMTWAQYCSIPSPCAHSNITRQWAELAYWFPSISYAEGAGGLAYNGGTTAPATQTVTSVDFSAYSPLASGLGAATHSYLSMQPYSVVFSAWTQIRTSLK